MASIQEKVGKVVRRLRTEKGYSQEEFAGVVRVHRTYMGVVERGESNLTLDTLGQIAKGLGISAGELLQRAERER